MAAYLRKALRNSPIVLRTCRRPHRDPEAHENYSMFFPSRHHRTHILRGFSVEFSGAVFSDLGLSEELAERSDWQESILMGA